MIIFATKDVNLESLKSHLKGQSTFSNTSIHVIDAEDSFRVPSESFYLINNSQAIEFIKSSNRGNSKGAFTTKKTDSFIPCVFDGDDIVFLNSQKNPQFGDCFYSYVIFK